MGNGPGPATVEALQGQGAESGFGEIKPTAVVVEIILDEHDSLGFGKMDVGRVLQDRA
jgi:hypothetical protein